MNLLDIVQRQPVPEPWADGEKIPWHDPGFSARMLREHLTQDHDMASRRLALIDRHVAWIHQSVLGARPAKILDLGCGPGLYSQRLARLGHTCVGIDFGPASIAYARQQAAREALACTYVEGDVRTTPFSDGFDLVMFVFGEINVFTVEDARAILRRANRALNAEGRLLLEPHTLDAVRNIGREPSTWFSAPNGLFSDRPHIYLRESFWDEPRKIATERHFVIDAAAGNVTRYGASIQGYTDAEYLRLLDACGFGEIATYPSLHGDEDPAQASLMAIVSRKQRAV